MAHVPVWTDTQVSSVRVCVLRDPTGGTAPRIARARTVLCVVMWQARAPAQLGSKVRAARRRAPRAGLA